MLSFRSVFSLHSPLPSPIPVSTSNSGFPLQVLLFSAMALKSRILHAYFDGQNLVIKKVPLLDFVANKKNAYERFLRAIANTPGGDTMSLPEPLPAVQLQAPQPHAVPAEPQSQEPQSQEPQPGWLAGALLSRGQHPLLVQLDQHEGARP